VGSVIVKRLKVKEASNGTMCVSGFMKILIKFKVVRRDTEMELGAVP
jgi:hypothetical protein